MPHDDPAARDRLGPWLKGFPTGHAPIERDAIAAQRWNVLAGDLPLPLALIKRDALAHNLAWMQRFAAERGVQLAPHGKTTMSPQLFARQLDAGAWGITFANVFQLRLGVVAAGVRRALIANQVHQGIDLDAMAALRAQHADLRVLFLVDSRAQLGLIEDWHAAKPHPLPPPFEVLLEVGIPGGRTGVRGHDEALALARALHASRAVRLAGIECYEGLGATGETAHDEPMVDDLMRRVERAAQAIEREGLFDASRDDDGRIIVSAGGSAVFDLVAARLRPPLQRPVRALLRSGCYVTHDHDRYARYVAAVNARCGCEQGLTAALEVWTAVQSTPEPGLALLTAGRRDVGFDAGLPRPIAFAPARERRVLPAEAHWRITALNDQHAHLHYDAAAVQPRVGDRIALGISHPCTTFDKWHWMAIVDADYTVVDAVTMHF